MKGHTVLVAAHGNSLRALIKFLDRISDNDIPHLTVPLGVPIVFDFEWTTCNGNDVMQMATAPIFEPTSPTEKLSVRYSSFNFTTQYFNIAPLQRRFLCSVEELEELTAVELDKLTP